MTDLQSVLDAIDRTLAECDASTLPPLERLSSEPVTITAPTAEEFADGIRVLATLGQPVAWSPATAPTPEQRGWLARWIRRNRR